MFILMTLAFMVAALTTPVGAFISYPLIQYWSSTMTGLGLGFVVGVLIYTSAAHLLPEAEECHKKHSSLSMLAGVGFSILMMLIGDGHYIRNTVFF